MSNIFEALRVDHELQRSLAAELVETHGDSPDRAQIFADLKAELAAHEDHEERQFYVPLFEHDLTQEKARHSVAEHKELDDFVERLESYEMSAPQWLITARELHHRLVHHLDEEEHEVFQLAGKALSNTQKAELGAAYEASMRAARRG